MKKKERGERIEKPQREEPSKVVNLMDALRRSAQGEAAGGGQRRARRRAADHTGKKRTRAHAKHRKAG